MKTRARPRQMADGSWLQVVVRRGASTGRLAGDCAGHADKPHATAAEANACWRDYLLRETLQLGVTRGEAGPCKACGEATNGTAVINGYPRDHWCPGTCGTRENLAAWWNAATAELPAGAS